MGTGQYGERGSVRNAELAKNVVQVDLHGPLSESQPLADFLVGHAFREHENYLALASGERVGRAISPFLSFVHFASSSDFPDGADISGGALPAVSIGFGIPSVSPT
jgi:hypothetical protein